VLLLVGQVIPAMLNPEFNNHWEVRHAALLTIRYILAVREDMPRTLLPVAFPFLSTALSDDDDEVRAAAAAALLPIVTPLTQVVGSQAIDGLVEKLWASTLDLDDLCASTAAVLQLLAELIQLNPRDHTALGGLLPRLFPFTRHNSAAVRKSVLQVLIVAVENAVREPADNLGGLDPILPALCAAAFKNVLLESKPDLLDSSKQLWKTLIALVERKPASMIGSVKDNVEPWLLVASQDTRASAARFDKARNGDNTAMPRAAGPAKRKAGRTVQLTEHHLVAVEGPDEGFEMQQAAAWALGYLAARWPREDQTLIDASTRALASELATSRRVAADTIRFWMIHAISVAPALDEAIRESLQEEMTGQGTCPFAELGSASASLFRDTVSLVDFLDKAGVPTALEPEQGANLQELCRSGQEAVVEGNAAKSAVLQSKAVPLVTAVATTIYESWENSPVASKTPKAKRDLAYSLRMRILSALGYFTVTKEDLQTALTASSAAALVHATSEALPKAVGPYIKALLFAVRTVKSPCLQREMAKAAAELACRLASRESKKPLSLMVKNLVRFTSDSYGGFLQGGDEKATTEFRGTRAAIEALCIRFGAALPHQLPFLWSIMRSVDEPVGDVPRLHALLAIRIGAAHLHMDLQDDLCSFVPSIIRLCVDRDDGEKVEAHRCLADVIKVVPSKGMETVITRMVPLLATEQEVPVRQGAVDALRGIVDALGVSLIPFAPFLVVPMMKRMIDPVTEVRNSASHVFGTLVRLMPLEEGATDDETVSKKLVAERAEAREFLGQLLGTRPRNHYTMPVAIGDGVELRKYQQDCLDWLGFLNKYGLHGALCDDMGLGKTLMTLCMIAASNWENRKTEVARPSLVVCPSTLVGHWSLEANRFFGHTMKSILMYAGPPRERARLRSAGDFSSYDLVITSYEVLGNDLDHLRSTAMDYLVLDEGHVIKNVKTKVAGAVRAITASHRLILTGTPIQNSVVELWAMFDFLMPGFLGDEKSFKEAFSKPIMASKDPKCDDKARDLGNAKMEALHRQVLPFILRRLKDDVLSELPPKIVQDYYCTMTPMQVRLYEDFSRTVVKKEFVDTGQSMDMDDDEPKKGKGASHVFQALQYLRKLCSHPALVLNPSHPEYDAITEKMAANGTSIRDIEQSSKLLALREILVDCGIGAAEDDKALEMKGSTGHRALIFAQMKSMLDIVETDLFQKALPQISYMRLDGSVEASQRQPIVTRFNSDPTIDCLLLTTHVGGLGLNLTGADTVIFLEHDWNPTRDLQAMDRAHRLGQKRTVNVYRLITRGTLEEKIMGIQKFKTHIANTVVNRENSSLQSMNTSELLDLFKVEDSATARSASDPEAAKEEAAAAAALNSHGGKGLKNAMAGLEELWDESQYTEEYDLSAFVQSLKQ